MQVPQLYRGGSRIYLRAAHPLIMAKPDYEAEADSDLNWLQFIANHEMQSLLPDNLFGNAVEDGSFTALLGLPAGNSLQQTSIAASETFADEAMNIEADGQKEEDCVGSTAFQSKGNLGAWPELGLPALHFATFPSDAALVERAAKFSAFANGNNSNYVMKPPSASTEESLPSTATSGNSKEEPSRLESAEDFKLYPKKKRKNAPNSKTVNSEAALKIKRCKGVKEAIEGKAEESKKKSEEEKNAKALTLPDKSNYIHVRARRGQATDSHSLAERVRRGKISERMKLLQDLVPGCSRITGKALMLDEIINHVQSLQREVEFLSMKLATVNRRLEFDINSPFSKEMMTPSMRESSNPGISPQLTASPYLQFQQPEQTSSMQAVTARTSAELSSLAWNAPFHDAYSMGFHPTRIQSSLESQAIPGIFELNHMMKRVFVTESPSSDISVVLRKPHL